MTYDFQTQVSRLGTGSYKYDSHHDHPDTIQMWVADMDIRTAPEIIQALHRRVDHGIFGYTHVPDRYYDALEAWFQTNHNYTIDPAKTIYTTGVVPAISAIIKALTEPGDAVIVQSPVYNCFYSSIRNNNCQTLENPLITLPQPNGYFTYQIDFPGLKKLIAENPRARVMLLCNPHNPGGRVWTPAEITQIAQICLDNHITLVSDEIHCDLTYPGNTFTSAGTLPAKLRQNTIICNSPSKTFNTAGLQIANIICGTDNLRTLVDRAINDNEVCDVNPFGVTALIAAYTQGRQWQQQLLRHLDNNRQILHNHLRQHLPQLTQADLQATYLAWIDTTPLGSLNPDEITQILVRDAHVRLSPGTIYHSNNHIRLNFACPTQTLRMALNRITPVLQKIIG